MENRRFILIALLAVVGFFMYQAWQADYGNANGNGNGNGVAQNDTPPLPPASPDDVPVAQPADAGESTGDTPNDIDLPEAVPAAAPAQESAAEADPSARAVIETDLVRAEVALQGGQLRRLELKGYGESAEQPDVDLSLLDDRMGRLFVLQSGLVGTESALVTHLTEFRTEIPSVRLAEGEDAVELVLTATVDGAEVRKIYRFERDSYRAEIRHEVTNTGSAALALSPYARFQRTAFLTGGEPKFAMTFTGTAFYEQREDGDGYRFEKIKLDNIADDAFETQQTGGWIGFLQHYFVTAILNDEDAVATFAARPATDQGYFAQYVGASQSVAPGEQQVFVTPFFAGPKLQDRLPDVAPGMALTIDYGILTPISGPLFWVLNKFHSLTGNWGFAIILLTLLVKGAMYKLSEAQYRSMAKMKKFAPRIADIRERYSDNREALQKAMMDLYKKEGFNPLAGCWPLLLQFPVFIALYWVLLESVELRQAPFIFWIQDLALPDPWFVLPVLFGISMWAQQKLSGQQMMDPTQQKIMMVMPIMLAAFFTFFQSGLVLYWLTSNLIGITQQWFIVRKLEREDAAKAAIRR
ncbi:membrane protein insertase YidC [Polycyclovorans algicola]|uniref:membrane protein insertase YidC n=1 Tax=Polycyclovorans algicola TaxID=616992 RepID=UPI0004A6B1EE|nr:membrane protein insertase YidC [Polycyclovorans algicola]